MTHKTLDCKSVWYDRSVGIIKAKVAEDAGSNPAPSTKLETDRFLREKDFISLWETNA